MQNESILNNNEVPNLTLSEAIQKKIKIAKMMLMLSAGTQVLSILQAILQIQKYNLSTKDLPDLGMAIEPLSIYSGLSLYSVLIIGLCVYSFKEINRTPWGWVMALAAFSLSFTSWALPFAVIGLLVLLDKEVRSVFLKSLDISL